MTTDSKLRPIPFGKYLLLDRVNIGGMAEVWRAKTFGAGGEERIVAVKRILPDIAADIEFISMFIDEAKITVQLAHANIAQILELSRISDSYFIAMEYVPGKDLRGIVDRCRKRGEPVPIPLACYVISRCCEGLDYAHRKKDVRGGDLGIVHRDVSPQNALISYEGDVKVIDFGIAKAVGQSTKTQAGMLKGKLGYMSPEQVNGFPLDRRSDVFAIGVCLHELLTGERLFVGDSDIAVLEKVANVAVRLPSQLNSKIPGTLDKIVMKALARDVKNRYQWAAELAADLNRFLSTTQPGVSRAELAAFMKSTFAEDYEKERQRMRAYAGVKALTGAPAGVDAVPVPPSPSAPSAVANAPNNTTPPPSSGNTPGLPKMLSLWGAGPTPAVLPPAPPLMSEHSSPSIPGLPQFAATASPGPEENDATVVAGAADVVVNKAAAPSTNPETRQAPRTGGERAPDSSRAVAQRGQTPAPNASRAPEPAAQQQREDASHQKTVATPGRATAPPRPPAVPGNSAAPGRSAVLRNSSGTSAPLDAATTGTGDGEITRPEGGRLWKKLLVLAGLAALVLSLAGYWSLKPSPKGLLFIDIPTGLEGKVRLSIDSKDAVEPDGSLLKSWPQIRELPPGKTTVVLQAEGYETVVEMVEVKEGNGYAQLTRKLEKRPEP